jgi:hypothetical protein
MQSLRLSMDSDRFGPGRDRDARHPPGGIARTHARDARSTLAYVVWGISWGVFWSAGLAAAKAGDGATAET